MAERNQAIFILTHGRAENVITYDTLRKSGYTGEIYLIIDDEDEQENLYRQKYGDHVIKFCKEEYLRKSMCINPDKPRKVILYARNACFDIAKQLGIMHFVEMDDDYKQFQYRWEENGKLKFKDIKYMDKVIDLMFDFLETTNALSVAMGQGGDLLGGKNSKRWNDKLLRKCMNSFFCRTDRPIDFIGSINEDVNTYVTKGNRGELFLTMLPLMLVQCATQQNKGGMTETYIDNGTYVKTFPTVMLNPSCVKVAVMGETNKRIHHRIYWDRAVPKILNEKYKKQVG